MTDFNHTSMPDWVSAPGETIFDRLEELGWTQKEFAERLGYTTKHVSLLINGKAPITEDTALRLERVIGGSAGFWLEREAQYREAIARSEAWAELETHKAWLRELPLREMARLGWVRSYSHKGQQVAECLNFFGVATIDAWRSCYANRGAAFRASGAVQKNAAAVGAWIRQAEREAAAIECGAFDKGAFRQMLDEARALTSEEDPEVFVPELIHVCRRAGVALVFVPTPRGCPVSGAARWLGSDKALIALSLRHKSNDHLWFSFFHEAGHIAKHSKKLEFIDLEGGLDDEHEDEANAFSRDHLIPPEAFSELVSTPPSEAVIREFARRIGIAPGIVVGRLQKEGRLKWSQMNHLKVFYRWVQADS